MADVATIAPIAPSPTVATAPVAPPAVPPPLSTLNEKASQLAGKISNQQQFEAALTSVGGQSLPAEDKGKLWDTVNQTRVGQGLPPLTVAQQNSQMGAANAALPPSVTGAPGPAPAAAPAPQPGASVARPPQAGAPPPVAAPPRPEPQSPLAEPVAPRPTAESLGLKPPQDTGPLDASGKPMAAPEKRDTAFTPAKYEPPKKGLLYAAAALSLLFPGSQIGRAAGSFAQGLNQGAQQKYQREEKTAEQKFEADKANAQTDYQNASAKYGAASEQAKRAFLNLQVANGATLEKATAAWDAEQANRAQRQALFEKGLDAQGKPIQPPPALAKPLGPKASASDYAQHENALAQWYDDHGIKGPAAQHAATAAEYQKQVQAQITQAGELQRTMATITAAANRTNATIAAAAGRQEQAFRQQFAMLDYRERDRYREQASRSTAEANKLWSGLTTPVTDGFGQTKPAIVDPKSPLYGALTTAMRGMTQGSGRYDPQGYAEYVINNTPSLKDNPIAQQVLQARATGLEMTLRSNGYQPVPFVAPPETKHPAGGTTALSFAQDAISHNVPLANIPQAMHDSGFSQPEIATTLKTLKVAQPRPEAPVDPRHPDAPALSVARGLQVVTGGPTKTDPSATARAAGLTPGTPAWDNYMRTHPAQP